MRKVFSAMLLFVFLVTLTGCTGTQKGATIGALGGTAAGGAIGYFAGEEDERTDDAWIGAGIGALTGAVVGGIIGYYSEE